MTALTLPTIASGVVLAAILIALVARDLRDMILPDSLNAALAAAGLAQAFLTRIPPPDEAVVAALVGGGLLYGVAFFYRLWRGVDGLGLGDVKLAAAAGPWVGLGGIGPMLVVATATAALNLAWQARRDAGFDAGARFPFGPYLAVGLFAAWAGARLDLW
jgi:leader peptidase (prepilin peptidase) / N-methyltransferase